MSSCKSSSDTGKHYDWFTVLNVQITIVRVGNPTIEVNLPTATWQRAPLRNGDFVMIITLTSLFAIAGMAAANVHRSPVEKPAVSFAFFGCNRIDAKDVDRTYRENPSTANVPQLSANLSHIAALKPDYAFLGGDIVMGYADDNGQVLRSELTAWTKLVDGLPKAAETQLIAIAGNHELNRKKADQKLPNPVTVNIWNDFVKTSNMIPAKIHRGPDMQHGFGDDIAADESLLSYSFDRDYVHFVVLNTDTRVKTLDPVTGQSIIGAIPSGWLENDLQRAQANKRIKSVVILGHRNVINAESVEGDAPIEPMSAKRLLGAIARYSKVQAYVCAHIHAMEVTTFNDNPAVQALFGNGGSKLEANWKPQSGRTFGFGMFQITPDGTLTITPYTRPEPRHYMAETIVDVPAAVAGKPFVVQARKK